MDILDTKQKAFSINLDSSIYGSFAEIGAGQEVGRHFFRAGGAAGTIAKTISAYDMVVSDTIYGKEKSGRYVCEERLKTMLDREFKQLTSRLTEKRSSDTRFFVFADTAAAKSYSGKGDCHGWLGVRFQGKAGQSASEVIIHIKLLDQENVQQQEALGIIGVNLIYACYNYSDNYEKLVASLMDGIGKSRIKIDMIRVSGKAFKGIDSRLVSLELVKKNYCEAILFDKKGRVVNIADYLYKKNLVVLRGSFRPPTNVNVDMINTGVKMFKKDLPPEERTKVAVLPEISMAKLKEPGSLTNEDFLSRVGLLSDMGEMALISNFTHYYELNVFLSRCSKRDLGFVTGVYNLQEILDPQKYENVEIGLLGSLGELIGHRTKLYIYPVLDDNDDSVFRTTGTCELKNDNLIHLLIYLMEEGKIKDITDHNPDYAKIWSRTVVKMIREGKSGWEGMLPDVVAKAVKSKKLFT